MKYLKQPGLLLVPGLQVLQPGLLVELEAREEPLPDLQSELLHCLQLGLLALGGHGVREDQQEGGLG